MNQQICIGLVIAIVSVAAAIPARGQTSAPISPEIKKLEDDARQILEQMQKPDFDQTKVMPQVFQLMQQFGEQTKGMSEEQVNQLREQMMQRLQPAIAKAMPNLMQNARKGLMDRLQKQLECSDEEFNALKPGLLKVLDAQQASMVAAGGMGPRRGGGQLGGMPNFGLPSSPVADAIKDLRETLDDPNAAPGLIKTKLDALRQARDTARANLETARTELRSLLTVRQESILVQNGILE